MAYVGSRIVTAHPFLSEAITLTRDGKLERWALGNPPRLIAEAETGYNDEWMGIAISATGMEIALVTTSYDRVERRAWEDLRLLEQIACPAGTEPDRVVFSPDGRTLAVNGFGSEDCLLEWETGRIVADLPRQDEGLNIQFSPNGRWLASAEHESGNVTLSLYEITGDGRFRGRYEVESPNTDAYQMNTLVFSPDSQWLAVFETADIEYEEQMGEGGWFGAITLYAVELGKSHWSSSLYCPTVSQELLDRSLEEPVFERTPMAFLAHAEVVCGLPLGQLEFYSVETGEKTRHVQVALDVAIISLSVDASARAIWITLDEGRLTTIDVQPSSYHPAPVLFLRDHSHWLPEVIELRGHARYIEGLAYSPDGSRIITISADETARLWDVQSGQEVMKIEMGMEASSVDFSRSGSHIAVGGKNLIVYDAINGQETLRLSEPKTYYEAVVFSPDSNYLLIKGHGRVPRLLDIKTGQTVLALERPAGSFEWVTFTPDGRYIVAMPDKKPVKFWEVPFGPEAAPALKQMLTQDADLFFLRFSLDGRRCFTSNFAYGGRKKRKIRGTEYGTLAWVRSWQTMIVP